MNRRLPILLAAWLAVAAAALVAVALVAVALVAAALVAVAPVLADDKALGVATPEPRVADQEQLRQVILEARIATGRPKPGLSLWARDAGSAVSRWMAEWMERTLPRFARLAAPFFEPAVMLLLALLTAVVLAFLARFALERWRRRRQAAEEPAVRDLGAAGEPAAARDWEAELRRRLDGHDVTAAIEALWWWLAGRLVGQRAEPSWTSRELVQRAGRRDLLRDVRRLDRMMYGAGQPSTGDVGRLWNDLREDVG